MRRPGQAGGAKLAHGILRPVGRTAGLRAGLGGMTGGRIEKVPEIKRFPYTPILGWSASRYDLFSICKRRYFYHYYAKYDQELPTRLIQQHKDLVSIPLEIGGIVHKVIEVLLNRLRTTTQAIDRPKFFDFAQRTTGHRVRTATFDEQIYGVIPEVTAGDLLPKIEASLGNLLESERLAWLTEQAADHGEAWIIDPPGYGETRLGDLKVYCKVDFLFPSGQDYVILDWKTGKVVPDKHRKQLMGYATWATYHFETQPSNVRPAIAYLLPGYEEVKETFNSFDLEHFAIQVRAETQEMYEYCRDIGQNIPLDKEEFPLVDDQRICSVCNFRGLCYPDLYQANFDH